MAIFGGGFVGGGVAARGETFEADCASNSLIFWRMAARIFSSSEVAGTAAGAGAVF